MQRRADTGRPLQNGHANKQCFGVEEMTRVCFFAFPLPCTLGSQITATIRNAVQFKKLTRFAQRNWERSGLKSDEIPNPLWGYPEHPDDVVLRLVFVACLVTTMYSFCVACAFGAYKPSCTAQDEAVHGQPRLQFHHLALPKSIGDGAATGWLACRRPAPSLVFRGVFRFSNLQRELWLLSNCQVVALVFLVESSQQVSHKGSIGANTLAFVDGQTMTNCL